MPNNVRATVGVKDNASTELDRIKGKFTALQKQGAKGIGAGIAAGATVAGINAAAAAVGGLGDAIGASIDDASNLNEQLSKSNVVFGGAGAAVEKFAKTAATSLGLSERAALEAAGTFGNFFTGVGAAQGKAAEMSTRLVALAGDLASFNNLDPTDVLDKLRAGLSGEAEPLRRVGVFLTEAKVKAKAMEMGLADTHGELSEGAKIMARYQFILDETQTAQGDFARTSDGMANQQRKLNAELENTSAALGTRLLPIVTEFQRTVLYALDRTAVPLERLKEAAEKGSMGAQAALLALEEKAKASGRTLEDEYAAMGDASISMAATTETSIGKLADDTLPGLAESAEDSADRVVTSFDDMVSAMSQSVGDLIDEVYDPAILHAELAADREEAAHLRSVISSKDSTDEEIKDAKRRMLSLSKHADETRLALLEAGQLTAEEAKTWLAKLRKRYAKEPGAAKEKVGDLIREVERLGAINGVDFEINARVRTTTAKRGKRAKGGPVEPGGVYTVGEEGPETLVMGNQGGNIIPNGKGGGDSYTININNPRSVNEASLSGWIRMSKAMAVKPRATGVR